MFFAIRLKADKSRCWYAGDNREHGQGEAIWQTAPQLFATRGNAEMFADALTERFGEYSTRRIAQSRIEIVCFQQAKGTE